MDWLRDNATWIKDILAPGFSLILVAVAVLAYRRAKETILQPFRSEVIKRQADIMAELLKFVSKSQTAKDDPIDYTGLCSVNAFQWLDSYGFVLANHKDHKEKINSVLAGFVFVGQDNVIRDVEVVQPFKSLDGDSVPEQNNDWRQLRYEKAKSGKVEDVEIDRIFLTNRHAEYQHQLDTFTQNPFLPSATLKVLYEFQSDIHYNLTVAIRNTVAEFISELMTRSTNADGPNPIINYTGVYNMFNRKRISHRIILANLRENIRKHLKIDSMP